MRLHRVSDAHGALEFNFVQICTLLTQAWRQQPPRHWDDTD
jgi:hypothetical protein